MSVGPCIPQVRSENSSFLPEKVRGDRKGTRSGLPVLRTWRSCNDNGDIHRVSSAILQNMRTLVNGGASTAIKAVCT